MNKILQINRKFLVLILIIISLLIGFLILKKNIDNTINEIVQNKVNQTFDIINPSFTINNVGEKVSVRAQKGNFLNDDIILLQNNVEFKSPRFKLETHEVIFDRNNQTAESESKSTFKSKGIKIISEGFEINENGEIILFNGNSILIIEK